MTSVYLDNRSVPDEHIRKSDKIIESPCCEESIKKYFIRIIEAIEKKIKKAKVGYNLSVPLFLGIYVNEYISIHIDPKDWEKFIRDNKGVFKGMSPFQEIVLWPLQNNDCLSIKLQNNNCSIIHSSGL